MHCVQVFTLLNFKYSSQLSRLWCVCTLERELGAQREDLGGGLVGVHAVTEGQLGHSATVLPTEVVRYGLVILRCVCEGLERESKTHA